MESKVAVILSAIHSLSVKHVVNVCQLVKDVDPEDMTALVMTSIVSVVEQYAKAMGEDPIEVAKDVVELVEKLKETENDKS